MRPKGGEVLGAAPQDAGLVRRSVRKAKETFAGASTAVSEKANGVRRSLKDLAGVGVVLITARELLRQTRGGALMTDNDGKGEGTTEPVVDPFKQAAEQGVSDMPFVRKGPPEIKLPPTDGSYDGSNRRSNTNYLRR